MTTEETTLVRVAQDLGFKGGICIKPAHLLHHHEALVISIPKEAELYINTFGDLIFRVGELEKFPQVDKPSVAWLGMVYDKSKNRWSEIVDAPKESLVGRYIKVLSPSLGGSSTRYKKGDYLKVLKDPAENYTCHSVEYINTLHIGDRVRTGDIELMPKDWTPETEKVPFSVRNDYRLPDKWCIKATSENNKFLIDFLASRKNEFNGYTEFWKNPLPGLFYVHYPQKGPSTRGWGSIQQGYTEITFEQFKKHVLKHTEETNQFTNVTELLENYGKSGTTTGTSIKVQRTNLSIRGGTPIRAVGVKCTEVKIEVRNGYSPD